MPNQIPQKMTDRTSDKMLKDMSEVCHGGYHLKKIIFIGATNLEYHTLDIKNVIYLSLCH